MFIDSKLMRIQKHIRIYENSTNILFPVKTRINLFNQRTNKWCDIKKLVYLMLHDGRKLVLRSTFICDWYNEIHFGTWSLCSCHRKKHFEISKNLEHKFGAYILTFYVHMQSLENNRHFHVVCKNDIKIAWNTFFNTKFVFLHMI